MNPTHGRPAALAILNVELDEANPDRILIRVRTIDDVLAKAAPDDQPFADARAAVSHLAVWLENWQSDVMRA